MADQNTVVAASDLPIKRPREEDEVEATTKAPDGISSVIPGWFSEISPMWPGLYQHPLIKISSFLPCFFLLSFFVLGCLI